MVEALLSASMTWSASRHLFICTSCTLTTLRASERTLAESSIAANGEAYRRSWPLVPGGSSKSVKDVCGMVTDGC